jgi:glycosyltransferase involved in cell wall biosynthesis
MSSPSSPILFTIPNFITAGSGRVMLNILEHLDRDEFAPSVCVSRKGGVLDREVESLGIPFIEAPFTVPPKPYGTLRARARVTAAVFQPYRGALWHSFHYLDDYTEPIIARMVGARSWIYTKKAMGWGSRGWTLRSILATRIVADNTDMMRGMFRSPLYHRKTRLIPHGVIPTEFDPGVPPHLGIRKSQGLCDTDVLIGCVAHLVPVKGHPTLIQAMASVPNAVLLIAGKPVDREYSAGLERMANDLGIADRVRFLGGVGDVPAFHAETDIFVLPTWAKWRMEGCPVALLEAMSCGKPCVATDIPGSRDLVENERTGLLVPPEDGDALAAALRRLVADAPMRRAFGEAARQRVLEHYTVEREAAAHVAMYREILAG